LGVNIGSCKIKTHPTQRAADGGYAARFLSVFLVLGLSRFDGESTLPPTAANADRWVAVNDRVKQDLETAVSDVSSVENVKEAQ